VTDCRNAVNIPQKAVLAQTVLFSFSQTDQQNSLSQWPIALLSEKNDQYFRVFAKSEDDRYLTLDLLSQFCQVF